MNDKRATRRCDFLDKTGKTISCHLSINQKSIDTQVTNLSLAGMSVNIPAQIAQNINNNIVINCTLNIDSKQLISVKGQPVWNHPIEDSPEYHSVGFYNFIPSEKDHRILLDFLSEQP